MFHSRVGSPQLELCQRKAEVECGVVRGELDLARTASQLAQQRADDTIEALKVHSPCCHNPCVSPRCALQSDLTGTRDKLTSLGHEFEQGGCGAWPVCPPVCDCVSVCV